MTPPSGRLTLSVTALAMGLFAHQSAAQTIVGNPAGNQTITQPPGTTLSINTLRVKDLSGVYYADKYCAVAGTLDDTCIRNALAAIPANSTLFIPPGQYNINSKILITKTVALVGAGRASTVLMGQTLGDALIQVDGSPNGIDKLELRDFTISTAVTRIWGWAINLRNSNVSNPQGGPFNVTLRNLHITSTYGTQQQDGIFIQHGYYYTLHDIQIDNSKGTGIALLGEWVDKDHHTVVGSVYMQNIRVTSGPRPGGSLFIGAYAQGIYGSQISLESDATYHLRIEPGALPSGAGIEAIPQNLFFDQVVADNGQRNAYVNAAMSVYLTNSWFSSATGATTGEGILIDGSVGSQFEARDIRISGCRVIANNLDGIRLIAGKQIWIDGCLIDANGLGANSSGVHVSAGVSDFHIHDSQFVRYQTTPSHQYSVRIDSGASDRYTILGNDLNGYKAGGAALLDGGSGTRKIIANNLTF